MERNLEFFYFYHFYFFGVLGRDVYIGLEFAGGGLVFVGGVG